jgi:hypothetical protein
VLGSQNAKGIEKKGEKLSEEKRGKKNGST